MVATRRRFNPNLQKVRIDDDGRPRHGVDDATAADLVERGALAECVELAQDRAQRQRHVVARVAVGDREDVQVVDLLAARLEVRERARNSGPEADEIGIGHRDGAGSAVSAPS